MFSISVMAYYVMNVCLDPALLAQEGLVYFLSFIVLHLSGDIVLTHASDYDFFVALKSHCKGLSATILSIIGINLFS